WKAAPLKLRDLAVTYKSSSCATDSASESLYIGEDDRALWRQSAELEAEPIRELVDAAAPFGQLQGETQALAVRQDGLLARASVQGLDLFPAASTASPLAGHQHLAQALGEAELLVLYGQGAHLGGQTLALPSLKVERDSLPAIA